MPKQEESPLGGLVSNWPALTALVVAALSLVLARAKLDSPRPTEITSGKAPDRTENSVPARLWQDPFSVVPAKPNGGTLEQEFGELLKTRPAPEGDRSSMEVLFILAYVDSQVGPDSEEQRRRERYAALSALGTAGYVPVSSEKLSYIALKRPEPDAASPTAPDGNTRKAGPEQDKAAKSKSGEADSIFVPFEWFKPRIGKHREKQETGPGMGGGTGQGGGTGGGHGKGTGGGQGAAAGGQGTGRAYQGICLLWVTDDVGQAVRLGSVCDIIPLLDQNVHAVKTIKLHPTYAVAGRIGSDRLFELVSKYESVVEAKQTQYTAANQRRLAKVKLYVTQSTVNYVRLDLEKKQSWLQPHYVIGTDDDLADALIEELKLRGIGPGESGNDIAIVCEWDTEYGRRMTPTFKEAVRRSNPNSPPETSQAGSRGDLKQFYISQYTYLRGLDGKLPGEKPKGEPDQKPLGDSTGRSYANPEVLTAEKGEGMSQVDYLRRLVAKMKTENGKLRAIGLVGSDVYDKLLLLKALRSSFPEAVFFTTDLDVRLLQPGDLAYTHNLIIASHYGLALNDAFQKNTPPFRSGYDTSSYLGYLLAVGFKPPDEGDPRMLPEWLKWQSSPTGELPELKFRRPRVYEVGRSGAYELTFREDNLFHANNPREEPWLSKDHRKTKLALGGTILVILTLPISRRWRRLVLFPINLGLDFFRRLWRILTGSPEEARADDLARGEIIAGFGVWSGVILTFILAMLMYRAHMSPYQEPFEWLEGLSAWPAELLRWLACLLSVFFVVQAQNRLVKRDVNIQANNKLTDPPPMSQRPWWKSVLVELTAPLTMWFTWQPKNVSLQIAWDQFRQFDNVWRRLWRCVLVGALYLCFFKTLDLLFDHSVYEARGTLAQHVDFLMRLLAGVCQVGLLVIVVDSTVLCGRFVRYLASAKSDIWPEGLLDAAAEERGIQLTGDADSKTKALKHWLALRLIDDVTNVVAGLIYKPFVILLLLLVAQSSIFENWHWNLALILTVLSSAATALVCAFLLQRMASNAQRDAVENMDKLIARWEIARPDDGLGRTLGQIRTDIKNMKSGAFASLYQNPAMRAALIPLGGGGGLAALEAIMMYV